MIRPPTRSEQNEMDAELQARVDAAYATAERLMDEESRGWPDGLDVALVSSQWDGIFETFEESVLMAQKALQPILRKTYMTFLLGHSPDPVEKAPVQPRLVP